MQGPLVDIALLGLLVVFFGIQQRSRPQLFFRYWFVGWLLVFCSFVVYELPTPSLDSMVAHNELKVDFLYLGGLVFLLSLMVSPRRQWRTLMNGAVIAILAWALSRASAARPAIRWLDLLLVLLLEGAILWQIQTRTPKEWAWHRRVLVWMTLGFMALMLGSVWFAPTGNLEYWLLTQIFLSVGILYLATGLPNSLDRYAGAIGFLAWGGLYPLVLLFDHNREVLASLYQVWNLPKYAVGFAMTLRIFAGAREDAEQLADRYKDLYDDFRLLYENHPLPMWIYDAATNLFLSANGAAMTTYGYTEEEFRSMKVDAIRFSGRSKELPGELAGDLNGASRDRPNTELELAVALSPDTTEERATLVRHRRQNGSLLSVELTEREILFQGRQARFVLAVDVTERERLNQDLFHLAQHDSLTGLPNRLLMDDRIEQCVRRCAREHKKAVLFTIDADRFKLINDTFGHLIGDETLKAIADRLRGNIRSMDSIARTGGEEFMAMIGGLNTREDAERIAGMFVRLFDQPLTLGSQEMKVSVSVGAALYPDDAAEPEALRRKSDQALYHAKRMGRNRFSFASEDVCATFDEAMAVEMALRDALRNDSFELHFQPIYDNTGLAKHFEALLRMKPGFGPVYGPAQFIPVAEESGLIIALGNWVVKAACKHLVQWHKLGGDCISVAINVSGRQLLQKGFTDYVLEMLREHKLPARALDLELTESSLMAEPVMVREAMEELANKGIRFAIDDFGTGYSSLARLADLPISMLKVDKSFVEQLDRTRRGDGIVTAIIQMAQTLQVQVVAEGVENESQLNLLLRRGCDLFQGYYLSKPLSPTNTAILLSEQSELLWKHPNFSQTRVAVSKRLRRLGQLPPLALAGEKAL